MDVHLDDMLRSGEFDLPLVQGCLGASPSLANYREGYTRLSLLHLASECGLLKGVRFLLDAGARPELEYYDGGTALHLAAKNGHSQVVSALVAAGASVDAPTGGLGRTPLHLAAAAGHAEAVSVLLQAGASPLIRGRDDSSALQLASAGATATLST